MIMTTIAAEEDSEVQRARETLESSAKAYRTVVALGDKLSYVVTAPGSEQETKTEEYAFGPKDAAIVKNALLQAVAMDSKLYLTQSDVPDRYVVTPYDGDFGAALRRVAGNGSLFEPPPLALHSGKGIDTCLDTLRFNLLEPLRIAGYRQVAGDKAEIRFVANNGELTLAIDSKTHFFTEVSFQVRPPGAPEGFLVRVNGTFSPRVLNGSETSIAFTPGSRSAVENLTDLTSTRLAAGSVAPDFELETLDGNKVALRDLKGSIVLLDFWATWCVPCWKGLKETQAIADWAAAEKLTVKVFAVNTLEQGSDTKEKLNRVKKFWRSQKLNMPTLLDANSKMFKAFESPGLPSVVLISPSGKILRYHEGLFPEMGETLKRELRESLTEAK
jgi:peroxiredoxin